MIKHLFIVIVLVCHLKVWAQDPIFTQSNVIQETLNPGFTGFEDNGRTHLGILHRTQWPNLNLRINTQYAFWNKSVDFGPGDGFGFGFSLLRHHESFTNYAHHQLNVNYAHRINLRNGWFFRPGIEVGAGTKNFQFRSLTLADQININTGVIAPNSIDPLANNNENVWFLDIGTGLVFEKTEINGLTYWFGVAVKHLNRPNISFVQGENLPLNMLFAIHGNLRFPFLNDYSVMLTSSFLQQGDYNRLDVGTLFQFNQFLIGVTAATNPARNDSNSHLLTSINGFIGLEYTDFRFGLSYDANTTGIGRTNGVYEFSVTYLSRCRSCNIDRSRKR